MECLLIPILRRTKRVINAIPKSFVRIRQVGMNIYHSFDAQDDPIYCVNYFSDPSGKDLVRASPSLWKKFIFSQWQFCWIVLLENRLVNGVVLRSLPSWSSPTFVVKWKGLLQSLDTTKTQDYWFAGSMLIVQEQAYWSWFTLFSQFQSLSRLYGQQPDCIGYISWNFLIQIDWTHLRLFVLIHIGFM